MNVKKGLIFSVAGVAMLTGLAAYAGGPEVINTAVAPTCPCAYGFTPFLYIGGSAGWAYSDWNSFILSGFPQNADTNGFTYGGKVGYQFLDHFGVEAGIFNLPDSDQTILANDFTNENLSGKVSSWFAYGAATIRAEFPGDPFFHIMGKVGGAYRAVNHSGQLYDFFNTGDGSYGTVIFGAGLDYDLAMYRLPLSVGVDYWYVPGSNDSFFTATQAVINENAAPAAQVVVGTISIHFAA